MKRAIVEQNNLGTQVEQSNFLFDDVQSGKRYSDDGMIVEKNTSVLVRRVPAAPGYNLRLRLASRYVPCSFVRCYHVARQFPASFDRVRAARYSIRPVP